jgi:hypothetical protein
LYFKGCNWQKILQHMVTIWLVPKKLVTIWLVTKWLLSL